MKKRKSWFFKQINKIDKLLAKNKKDKLPLSGIKTEKLLQTIKK